MELILLCFGENLDEFNKFSKNVARKKKYQNSKQKKGGFRGVPPNDSLTSFILISYLISTCKCVPVLPMLDYFSRSHSRRIEGRRGKHGSVLGH